MSDYQYPLALTGPKTDSADFTDWLGPNSRLPSDIVFVVDSVTSSGEVLGVRISAHKAIIAKAIPSLDEALFGEKLNIKELMVKATHGRSGIKAFKLFMLFVYGRKIKMEEITSFPILANLAGFGDKYSVEEMKDSAVARMEELVEKETDYQVLVKISALAGNNHLDTLKGSTTAKIQAVITEELNTSVLAKLNDLEIVEHEKDRMRILRDLANLASRNKVDSLRSAVAAHMEAIVVTEENFSSLVGMADSTELMKPLRKALSRYIKAHYSYTEELGFFLKSQQNLEIGNLFPILVEVHEKEEKEE